MGSEKRDTRRLEHMKASQTFSTTGGPASKKIVPYPIPTGTVTLTAPPPIQEDEDDSSGKAHTVRERPRK